MLEIILGNLCSLAAMLIDSYSSTKKTKKEILLTQNFSQIMYGTSSIFLKGYSASAQNFVSIIRNIVSLREHPKWMEWFLVGLGVVLGLVFNNLGIIGLLPIIANLEYSIAVFVIKDNEKLLKICFIIMCAIFVLFNIFIYNIVGTVLNIVVIISCIINISKK